MRRVRPGEKTGLGMLMMTDETCWETACQLERENPDWIVVFGAFSRQFVAFPKFAVPSQTIVVALYPAALPPRLREVERRLGVVREH
jgi:hypothetical protein